MKARHRLRAAWRALTGYQAAENTRTHPLLRDARSADARLSKSGTAMVSQTRDLENDYDIADGVLATLVQKTIGTGLVPEPRVMLSGGSPAGELNAFLVRRWGRWAKRPEVTRRLDAYAAQRLAARQWFRDGEDFTQLLIGGVPGLAHSIPTIPLSIEQIECDLLPFDFDDPDRGIVQSVQKNAWGAPVGYWLYKQHPGDANAWQSLSIGTENLKFIPAARMTHVATRKRARQTRGVTVLHSSILRLRDIMGIDEAENIASRVASCLAAVVTSDMGAVDTNGQTIDEPRQTSVDPGMFAYMRPGEKVDTIDSSRPNNDVIAFRNANLRGVAAGTGASYSTISKTKDGSYSAQRAEMVDDEVVYRILTDHFVGQRERPIWEAFARLALLEAPARLLRGVDRESLLDVAYQPPATPWIDPEKEAKADQIVLGAAPGTIQTNSWSNVIRRRGLNPETVKKQIEEEAADPVLSAMRERAAEADDTEGQNQPEEQADAEETES